VVEYSKSVTVMDIQSHNNKQNSSKTRTHQN